MSNKMIINIVSCVVAVALVVTSTFFMVRHFKAKDDVIIVPNPTGGSYSVDGNINDEVSGAETTATTGSTTTTTTTSTTATTKPTTTKSTATTTIPVITAGPSSQGQQNVQVQQNGQLNNSSPATQENAQKEAGTLGFMWNPEDEVFYSAHDPWQRHFGYNAVYDWAASLVVIYIDTVRVKFNYGGYDWMVQLWKGQYGFVLLGAEVGVYYKDEGSPVEHYICTDNDKRLKVGFTCYNHGAELFERQYQDTWWLTGFVPGKLDRFADRTQMAMRTRITLKDSEMKNKFVEGLQGCGFAQGSATAAAPDTYYTSGNDVYIYWQYIAQ